MASKLDKIEVRSFNDDIETPFKSKKTAEKKVKEDVFEKLPLSVIKIESNIRTEYDEEEIQNLANSLAMYGQLEPIKVYEAKDEYYIIFGHRRFIAAQRAKLPFIDCIIAEKPDTLEKIYIQAVENEHSVNLSSSDREKYVKMLKSKYKQSVPEIAKKLGKSEAWVYKALDAYKKREKYESVFNNAGLQMSTRDASLIPSDTSREELKKVVEIVKENAGNKTKIMEDFSKRHSEKKGTRTAKIKNTSPLLKGEKLKKNVEKKSVPQDTNSKSNINVDDHVNISYEIPEDTVSQGSLELYKDMKITLVVSKDTSAMKAKIKASAEGAFYDSQAIEETKARLISIYEKEGYNVES